ncbi:MAG: hypothetical protein R3F11_24520 [Verrucomicrobiales bacterium]
MRAAPQVDPIPARLPDQEYRQFKEIVFGEEMREMEAMRARVAALERSFGSLGDALPGAIRQQAERGYAALEELSQALVPATELAVASSVAADREPLSRALFPIMGPAIRSYLATFFKGLIDDLNETVRNATSPQRWRWRAEAKLKGVGFAEYVLRKTEGSHCDIALLLARRNGELLWRVGGEGAEPMAVAVATFLKESVADCSDAPQAQSFEFGRARICVVVGRHTVLAARVAGMVPDGFPDRMEASLAAVEDAALANEPAAAEVASRHLSALLFRDEPGRSKAGRFGLAVFYFGLAAALCAGVVWQASSMRRWSQCRQTLEDSPGIEVLSASRNWIFPGGQIDVLRDPLAEDPSQMATSLGYAPGAIRLREIPFRSGEETFEAKRAEAQRTEAGAARALAAENGAAIASLGEQLLAAGRLAERAQLDAIADALTARFAGVPDFQATVADGRVVLAGRLAEPEFSALRGLAARLQQPDRIEASAVADATDEKVAALAGRIEEDSIRYISGAKQIEFSGQKRVADVAVSLDSLDRYCREIGRALPTLRLIALPLIGENVEPNTEVQRDRLDDARRRLAESGIPDWRISGVEVSEEVVPGLRGVWVLVRWGGPEP